MSIFAISDLHLSLGADKPMDIFGPTWEGYTEKIKENWEARITDSDTVLIPGDISWAMRIQEAEKDFVFLDRLPGRKIVSKGNHDYWWNSMKKIKEAFDSWGVTTIDILHNNYYEAEGYVICGTRGWRHPDSPDATEQDRKVYERELHRLTLSLESAKPTNKPILCGLHYPPFGPSGEDSEFTELLEKYGVKICIYGHIHYNFDVTGIVRGMYNGIHYRLVSADYLQFKPSLVI
ncbi:MAG: metallophosphoesterase [Clostridia bacterium]|jgi:predicted phosphohydrolase|nr:serine/threonine protein phosphatase [Clostridiaceae bacterium]